MAFTAKIIINTMPNNITPANNENINGSAIPVFWLAVSDMFINVLSASVNFDIIAFPTFVNSTLKYLKANS